MKCVSLCLLSAGLLNAANQYSYDAIGRLTKVGYTDGTVISYTYDSVGNRLSQVISNPSIALPTIGADKTNLTFSASAGQASAGTQIITIRNTGSGALQWNAVASVSWISITPGSGTDAGVVNVSASASNLAPGSYTGNVMIFASASNAPLTIPVSFSVTAAAGRPAISPGGIVTAAGYQAIIARGSISSIFGTSLANVTDAAAAVPLPRSLSGVRVTANGVDAPLWFVSSGQINFQVPFETPLTGLVPVTVYRDDIASLVANVQVQEYAPGIFTYERTPGVFDPIVIRTNGAIVSPTNPALPGDILVVYGTGLGNLTVTPQTGDRSPISPPAKSQATPTITLGGARVEVQYSGMTGGAVGLAQFNIKLPASLPRNDSLPLVIQFGNVSSSPVNLAIRSTGPTRPDVTIQVTDVQPRSPLATDNMWIAGDVKNSSSFRGDLVTKMYTSQSPQVAIDSAQASAPITLTLNGTGGSYTWSSIALPQGLKPGTYYVALGTMFPGNTDPQGVALSNAMQIEILAQRAPFDLAVQLRDVSPLIVGAGDPVAVHYAVSEAGGVSGTFSRSIYLSNTPAITSNDTLVNTRTFDLLKGSLDQTSTGNSTPRFLTPGNYYVGVIVQTAGDSNPANNTSSSLPITVISQRAPFDIGVQVVAANPSTVAPGGTFIVDYNIRNTSKSTGIYNRWVYLSTGQTIDTSGVLVGAGTFALTGTDFLFRTIDLTLPASVTPGKYYVGVIVESQGDTNPADNISNGIPFSVSGTAGTNSGNPVRQSLTPDAEAPQAFPADQDTPVGAPRPKAQLSQSSDSAARVVNRKGGQ